MDYKKELELLIQKIETCRQEAELEKKAAYGRFVKAPCDSAMFDYYYAVGKSSGAGTIGAYADALKYLMEAGE